jgi:16S rRNA (guanine(966)-N(2))-methyltransferase RsmD
LRIIGGTFKGRIIKPPQGLPARPTTDFAKEALFNVLVNRVDFEELHVLDLFSGTGNISFEFASRGAKSVTIVEKHAKSIFFIKSEFEKLNYNKVNYYKNDAFSFLKSTKQSFDLIFADPPFQEINHKELHQLLTDSYVLAQDGILIIEHQKKTNLSDLKFFKETKNYGNISFSFFSKENL